MVCSECKRPVTSDVCTGCRTLSRLKWLWQTQIGLLDEAEALSCLRNCAGGLTDLGEQRAHVEAQAAGGRGTGATAPDLGPEPAGTGEKADAEKRESPAPGAAALAKEAKDELEDKAAKSEDKEAESYSYETEVEEEAPPAKPLAETPRWGRGSLSKPLGLTPASKPSTRKPEKPFDFRGKARQDSPARDDERKRRDLPPQPSGEASGSRPEDLARDKATPRSPSHPPPGRHKRRHRSKSPKKDKDKKKSKGKRKRERGKEFRQAYPGHHASSGAWRRR